MINTMPFVGPAVPVQPVPINVKLAAINAMLDQKQKPRAKQVSSSPNRTLDLRHPVQQDAYFYVHGLWQPKNGSVTLSAEYHDRVCLVFCAFESKPYLLDVSVESTPGRGWTLNVNNGVISDLSLTPQFGHLLYPFMGGGVFNSFRAELKPPPGGPCRWIQAELTIVD